MNDWWAWEQLTPVFAAWNFTAQSAASASIQWKLQAPNFELACYSSLHPYLPRAQSILPNSTQLEAQLLDHDEYLSDLEVSAYNLGKSGSVSIDLVRQMSPWNQSDVATQRCMYIPSAWHDRHGYIWQVVADSKCKHSGERDANCPANSWYGLHLQSTLRAKVD